MAAANIDFPFKLSAKIKRRQDADHKILSLFLIKCEFVAKDKIYLLLVSRNEKTARIKGSLRFL